MENVEVKMETELDEDAELDVKFMVHEDEDEPNSDEDPLASLDVQISSSYRNNSPEPQSCDFIDVESEYTDEEMPPVPEAKPMKKRKYKKRKPIKIKKKAKEDPSKLYIPCRLCSHQGCKTVKEVQEHIKYAHFPEQLEIFGTRNYVCPLCSEEGQSFAEFCWHLRRVHQQLTKPILLPEFQAEKDKMMVRCSVCSRQLNSTSLKCHMRSHIKNYPFHCPFRHCSKKFKFQSGLENHKKSHEEGKMMVDQMKYHCDYPGCLKKYNSLLHFKYHRARHEGPVAAKSLIHKCSQCPAAFFTSFLLIEHRKAEGHRDDLSQNQNQSSQSSSSRKRLYKPRPEVVPKNHSCHFCPQSFPQGSQLRKHMADQHPNEKPKLVQGDRAPHQIRIPQQHFCPHCGGEFQSMGYLRLHIRRGHKDKWLEEKKKVEKKKKAESTTGKTGFSCTHKKCGIIFPTKPEMLEHVKAVHRTKFTIKCLSENCSRVFASEMAMKNHVKLVHPYLDDGTL